MKIKVLTRYLDIDNKGNRTYTKNQEANSPLKC